MSPAEIIEELDALAMRLCSGFCEPEAVAARLRAIAKFLKSTESTNTKK
jgi:hypothetical protein